MILGLMDYRLRTLVWGTAVLGLLVAGATASAETIVEAWRSPFGTPWAVSVNPSDGSCWAATGNSVMHLTADGSIVSQTNGFLMPAAVSVNHVDGTCWVADSYHGEVVHLSAEGEELARVPGFFYPASVSANPIDGSCWVADPDWNLVAHVGADGTILRSIGGFISPYSVAVNPDDGSCWVADTGGGRIVHVSSAGTVLFQVGALPNPVAVSVNPTDGSCWAAVMGDGDYGDGGMVLHLTENGIEMSRNTEGDRACALSVNPTDGSCWVSYLSFALDPTGYIFHLGPDGSRLPWLYDTYFYYAYSVSADGSDGSCWVADTARGELLHLMGDGTTFSRFGGLRVPLDISLNLANGSLWMVDPGYPAVMHLDGEGNELWRSTAFDSPMAISVNSSDGSYWVSDSGLVQKVFHMAEDGAELWRGGGFNDPVAVAVNPADGSGWIPSSWDGQVIHLDANGLQLWRGGSFEYPVAVSVYPADGSCWVADRHGNAVIHLASDGWEIWRGDFYSPWSVAVDPSDGSCWVAEAGSAIHLGPDGTELSSTSLDAGFGAKRVGVNPADGSCWVGGLGGMVHLAADGSLLWQTDPGHCTSLSVNPTDGSCWAGVLEGSYVVHIAQDGTELSRTPTTFFVAAVSVDPVTGRCWVTDFSNREIFCLSEDGTEIARFGWPGPEYYLDALALAVYPQDGSCWVTFSALDPAVIRLAQDGTVIWRTTGGAFVNPGDLDVNPTDGSCWALDNGHRQVVRLAENGAEPFRSQEYPNPFYNFQEVAVDPVDGSCWVTFWVSMSGDGSGLMHFAADGTMLWSRTDLAWPAGVDVNPLDGSCWMADYWGNAVYHIASDGTELWRGEGVPAPSAVCIDPTNGSCWVGTDSGLLIHLGANGEELWWSWEFGGIYEVQVDPSNGSCWVLDGANRQLVHLRIVPGADFSATPTVGVAPCSVSFVDRSTCAPTSWLWEFGDGSTSAEQNPIHEYTAPGIHSVRLTVTGDGDSYVETKDRYVLITFRDVPLDHWALYEIISCVDAGIVHGYEDGAYKPSLAVSRAQMAVYISRALAGGDSSVPDGPATPTFLDVPNTGYGDDGTEPYWAYKYVEYAVDSNVVQGYEYPDPDTPGETFYLYAPSETVTRDQMAVYVARALVAPTGEAALADYVPAAPRNFPDVPSTGYGDDGADPFWAYKHIEYCVEHGVVQGYEYPDPDTPGASIYLYQPLWPVTRDQMAVYIARAFRLST